MPELPEVETILSGLRPHCEGQKIKKIIVRNAALRRPVPHDMNEHLQYKRVQAITRRGKYLLFHFDTGHALLHLGMSGRLRLLTEDSAPEKHDHFDIHLMNNTLLRYTDPRRFGLFLWASCPVDLHPLLKHLGPEPFERRFSGNYLWKKAQGRQVPIKTFLMDNKIVVGVGNIYAAESLFLAKISPLLAASSISKTRFNHLATAIKRVLKQAVLQGGTTLKDFVNSEGKPGYFAQSLKVYGRAGLSCVDCKARLISISIRQRSTVYCASCQQ